MESNRTFNGFIFESSEQKTNILSVLDNNPTIVLIESKGGMGGTTLLKAYFSHYKEYSVYNPDRSNVQEILLNKNVIDFAKEMNFYQILFIDGFQELIVNCFNQFCLFAEIYIKNGGKLFLKGNPSEQMNSFKVFAKNYNYCEIPLLEMSETMLKKLYELIYNDWMSEKGQKKLYNMLHYKDTKSEFSRTEIQESARYFILSLPYSSYRCFLNFVVFRIFIDSVKKQKASVSIEDIEKNHNAFF
ncbi:MAG TPA: hypothetical protein PLP27_05480 [Crocinitomicaceae bacterium]|nr:hypothetical protein [Crocinitomicaceae bacterium]